MPYRTFSLLATGSFLFLLSACAQEPNIDRVAAPQPAPGTILQPIQSQGSQAAPTNGATGGAQRLNPPHGEPGHVCEIEVGAPLDGSAPPAMGSNMPTQSITIPPSGGNIAPTSAPAGNMSGKPNPAHGEPGHVCEIGVGEILP